MCNGQEPGEREAKSTISEQFFHFKIIETFEYSEILEIDFSINISQQLPIFLKCYHSDMLNCGRGGNIFRAECISTKFGLCYHKQVNITYKYATGIYAPDELYKVRYTTGENA